MNPFDFPYLYWSRWYGSADGQHVGAITPGQLCSWSFTAEHVQSAVTCEPVYEPRGEPYVPPVYVPEVPVDSLPGTGPVTVTPEPATLLMLALGVAIVMVVRRVRP